MALYVITRSNNRWRNGTYFETVDGETMVQECVMKQEGTQLTVEDNVGFVIPLSDIAPYAIRVGFRGRPQRV